MSTGTLGLLATSAAAAQTGGKVYRIGLVQVFRQSLRDLGYVEGRNLLVEVRLVERQEVLPDAAAELIRLSVDVIAVGSTVPALAAKRATSTIPIVLVALRTRSKPGSLQAWRTPAGMSPATPRSPRS
jgi:ABC-type uncharacterized transport system substrate-binding protein